MSGFWSGTAAVAIPVLSVLAYSYITEKPIEIGDIKVGAIPQIEDDPAMNRCRAVQAYVENIKSTFAEVKTALGLSMRDVQGNELAARALWSDMVKSRPDDTWSQRSLIDDIDRYGARYSALEADVNNRLDYIGQVLDYILSECGLPARE